MAEKTITVIDEVWCRASRDLWPAVSRLMEYKGERWKQGRHSMEREEKIRSFLDHRGGKFLVGFLPRVLKEIPGAVTLGNDLFLEPIRSPDLFSAHTYIRLDQYKLQQEIAKNAAKEQRGVIQAPTGSGKTTIAMLIASMFHPKHRILFLCHTISLLTQSFEEFKKGGFKHVGTFGGGGSKRFWDAIINDDRVVISTIQTFSKFDPREYCDQFDVVIVDEAHHVNAVDSQYGMVLTHLLAPGKIGFTATVPTDRESALALEGLIGPVIGKVSIQEGVDMKIMAKPKIKLVPVPYNSLHGDIRKYQDLYKAAIVDSRARNSMVAEKAAELSRAGHSSLIIVKEIQHGDNLVGVLRIKGVKCEFVHGATDGDTREKVKRAFDRKDLKVVICTAVWKEGVNIPSLNCVINAAGGKSEIATLQAIGRGLRSVPGKEEIIVVDFLDPYKYLAQHAVQRISIYVEAGWL